MEKYSKSRIRCKLLTCLAYNLQIFSIFMPRLRVSRKNIKSGQTSVQETVAYVEYPVPTRGLRCTVSCRACWFAGPQ